MSDDAKNLALIAQHMNAITPIDWATITNEYGITKETAYETVATDVIETASNMPNDDAVITTL